MLIRTCIACGKKELADVYFRSGFVLHRPSVDANVAEVTRRLELKEPRAL